MKYYQALLLCLIVCLTGCGGRGKLVTLAGSTSIQPLAETLAEDYMKVQHGVEVNVQGGGSSAGIEAAQNGVAEIGMSSRELKGDERSLIETVIAHDAIAVIVHKGNPLAGLTSAQLRDIYAGRIKTWDQLAPGLPNKMITVVTREEGSGTRGAFEDLIMKKDYITDQAIVEDATGVVREIVAGDPNAIGYISLGIANEAVKILNLDGVQPSLGTVRAKKYPLSRSFIFVTRQPPAGQVKEFIDYVLSPPGQKIIEEEGYVPVLAQ